MDDPYQTNYQLKNKCQVVWISLNNKKADIYASDIKINKEGMSFLVTFKDTKESHIFNTKLFL